MALRTWLGGCAAVMLVTSPDARASTLLYDIDFSNDAVGSLPDTDIDILTPYPRTVPYRIVGEPTVVASVGPLTDQPLRFVADETTFDQLHVTPIDANQIDSICRLNGGSVQECTNFGPRSAVYEIMFDLVVMSLDPGSRFTMLLDAPAVRRVDFYEDGSVQRYFDGVQTVIGSYELGELLQVVVGVDLIHDVWSISLNGTTLDVTSFGDASNVRNLRWGITTTADFGEAAIDNIQVYGAPEPGTAGLLGLGLAMLSAAARARRRGLAPARWQA